MSHLLRFCTSKELDSDLIRLHTDCIISHVEYYRTEDGETFGSRLDGGVKWRAPDESSPENVIYSSFSGIEEAATWAAANRDGWPYDMLGILGSALATDWHDNGKRFCSALIAESMKETGVYPFSDMWPFWRVWPVHLLMLRSMTLIAGPSGMVEF